MDMTVRPFLMFEGKAEEALKFYVSLFPGSELRSIKRYGPGEAGPEGTIFLATFTVAGQEVMCSDSFVKHEFGFTPSFSLFVQCGSVDELTRLYAALSEGGATLMPPGEYGFSRRFAWVNDRFGVSWQLNVE